MGGGKSFAACQEVLDLSLEHPGLVSVVARQEHTSITTTTKKTMREQVLPVELVRHEKQSGGEDYVELVNGSRIHFIGLDKPSRWFSSELGLLVVDQAEECSEETIVLMITRLRQRCQACLEGGVAECEHMPNKAVLTFNPENPGHWLFRWFMQDAEQTERGFYKRELFPRDATRPIGDCEFVFARAYDNPYLPPSYIERNLAGLPEPLRLRMLEGEWLFTSGTAFFDADAMADYRERLERPRWQGETRGSDERLLQVLAQSKRVPDERYRGKVRVSPSSRAGAWSVWKPPIRERFEDGRLLPAHRYVASVDVSSGEATDFSAIQVVDVDEFAQVAEFQAKLDPDLLAVEAYRIGMVYNLALVAPEITGGWGFTIVKELQRLRYPRLYTRRIQDRLSDRFTDKLGWDTTMRTRALMLDTLERVVREREFVLRGARTLHEMATFVRDRNGRPDAQPGCNDDLVITLAIAVTIASQLPRQLQRRKEEAYVPAFSATGW